jgi:hypothetical protein
LKIARLICLIALVGSLVVGVILWFWPKDESSTTTARSTTTTTSVVVSTTVPSDGPFAPLAAVLPETLDGYRIDMGAKATGALNLEAAAAAEPDSQAERALLETRHFES